jgi:hypothetical protein
MKIRAAVAVGLSIGVLALMSVYAPRLHAQSADLILCDRVAADPSDLDKPKDAVGVTAIAASDIADGDQVLQGGLRRLAPRHVPTRPGLRRKRADG